MKASTMRYPVAGAGALFVLTVVLALSCSRTPSTGDVPAKVQPGAQGAAVASGQGQGAQGAQGQGQGGRRAAVIPVQATTVGSGILSADRSTAGVVTPLMQSQIAAPVSGIVAKVLRQQGDWVASGTIVIQLDDSLLKITLSNAQAAVETARINLETTQQNASDSLPRLELQVQAAESSMNSAKRTFESQKALFDLGGISASALDLAGSQLSTAKANLESAKMLLDQAKRGVATTPAQNVDALKVALLTAQNNLEQAKYNLANAAIKAPFDGQISSMTANPGMFIGQNTAAFLLVSLARQVSFSIAPSDARALKTGITLSYEVSGKAWPIRVRQAPSNPINGVVPMTASLPPEADLPFGTIGNVSYLVDLAEGTLIPLSSIQTLENTNYVFIVANGKVATQNIVVVAESGIIAAVTGINPGSMAVVSPPPGLIVGSQVQAIEIPMPASKATRVGATPAPGQAGAAGGQYGGQRSGQGGSPAAAGGAQSGAQRQGQAPGTQGGGQYGGQRPGQTPGTQGSAQYSGQRPGRNPQGGQPGSAPTTTIPAPAGSGKP